MTQGQITASKMKDTLSGVVFLAQQLSDDTLEVIKNELSGSPDEFAQECRLQIANVQRARKTD